MAVDQVCFRLLISIHFADIRGRSLKLSKIVHTVDFGWVHIGQRNFAVSGWKFTNFFVQLRRNSCQQSLFKIVDIYTHSRDIRVQIWKLYEIASNFGRFLLSQILGRWSPQKSCTPVFNTTSWYVTWQSFVGLCPLPPKLLKPICWILSQFFTPFEKNCWGNPCPWWGVR